jgi:hypothetical protein
MKLIRLLEITDEGFLERGLSPAALGANSKGEFKKE